MHRSSMDPFHLFYATVSIIVKHEPGQPAGVSLLPDTLAYRRAQGGTLSATRFHPRSSLLMSKLPCLRLRVCLLAFSSVALHCGPFLTYSSLSTARGELSVRLLVRCANFRPGLRRCERCHKHGSYACHSHLWLPPNHILASCDWLLAPEAPHCSIPCLYHGTRLAVPMPRGPNRPSLTNAGSFL